MASKQKQKLVIIGNGMVSARFCEHLVAHGLTRDYEIVVLGDEVRPAYNRVKLSTYFQHNDAEKLQLLGGDWYQDNGIELRTRVAMELDTYVARCTSLHRMDCHEIAFTGW